MAILQWSAEFLKSKGLETPRLDAELLLCAVLGFRRVDLYTKHDRPVDEFERQKYRDYIRRRVAGEPVAYILGEKNFYGRDFKVDSRVLIPRPETELLVERVIEELKTLFAADSARSVQVLDIGAGSGCIAITLAAWWLESGSAAWPEGKLTIEAWDVSEDALSLARENADRIGVTNWISFYRKDMLRGDSYSGLSRWDIVVSNPPYIGFDEVSQLSASVKDYEPHLALFADDDGIACYRALAEFTRQHVAQGGKIFLEIGSQQSNTVKKLLEINGWSAVRVELDYAQLPRNVIAVNQG